MIKIIMCLILAVFMFAAGGDIRALTPEEIMDRRDENEFLGSAYMEAEMIIEGRRTTEKRMYSYSQGPDAFVEFLNPRDRGTKYLKLGDDLWMFFPEAEERIHISGHMLREGMMGSDFSYQDMLESEKLTELYNFEITGEEQLDSRPVYVLRGKVKDDAEASYYERKIWVDSERFIGPKVRISMFFCCPITEKSWVVVWSIDYRAIFFEILKEILPQEPGCS